MRPRKDWTGNKKSVFSTLGASSHTEKEREGGDYYATHPIAVEWLLKFETFDKNVWECACGGGHISKVLEKAGYNVRSSDLFDRGYGEAGIDFLSIDNQYWNGDIITNPPYRYAQEFVEKALQIIPEGKKVAMLLRLQFLEGKQRKNLFLTCPPKVVYISSSRLLCAKNAEFDKMIKGGGSAIAFAWFVWVKGYKGDTIIKWFN